MEALHNTLMGLDQDVIIRDVISFSAPVTRHLEPHVGPEYAIIIAVAICIYAPLFVLGYAFFALIGQKGFRRAEMASCVPSMLHGSVTVFVCAIQMYQHLNQGSKEMDVNNSPAHVDVILFSCAYFLSDVVIYLIPFARHEYLFFFHHWLVSSYMLLALHLGFGAISAIAMIFLGELTSPFQNVWFWFKSLRYSHAWADDAFKYISWTYAAFYILVRAVFGPCLVVLNCYSVSLSERIPYAIKSYWIFCMVFTLLGSQIWVKKISVRLFTPYHPAFNTKPDKMD